MVKNKAPPDPVASLLQVWFLSLSLSLSLLPMPFILRVPLDPAEAGPQEVVMRHVLLNETSGYWYPDPQSKYSRT